MGVSDWRGLKGILYDCELIDVGAGNWILVFVRIGSVFNWVIVLVLNVCYFNNVKDDVRKCEERSWFEFYFRCFYYILVINLYY